jgi:hypothetical protein
MATTDVFRRQADEVRAIFGGLEIIEATTDIVVYVTAEEQQYSKRGDPNNCMFSNACKRAFGSQGVLFYPSVAYVDMIDPRDPTRRIVMRFLLPPDTRRKLESFDLDASVPQEATFFLKAVPRGQTLAAKAKAQRKRAAAARPAMTAERAEAAKKGHATRRARALMGVRSGQGQIRTRPNA